MERVYCTKCHRLEQLCLCSALPELDNQVELVFLQHPLEQKQIKGTAWLTHASLSRSRFIVGERFDDDALSFINDGKQTFLLYPEMEDRKIDCYTTKTVRERFSLQNCRVIILDGTWKKTRKMLFLNTILQQLPRIQISPESPSSYHIRKQKNSDFLSTLEATKVLLTELEQTSLYEVLDDVLNAIKSQYLHFSPQRNIEE